MIQFYSPDIKDGLTLPEEESAHCCRVLRMKEGDRITVVDGKDGRYECVIVEAHPKHTAVEITEEYFQPPHWKGRIVIAVAPTKNIDRIEWFLEKAVEIGVDEICLLKCDRSERKNVKIERLEKIVVSAMKQSLKARLPRLSGLVPFKDFVKNTECSQKFMGYCDKDTERKEFVKELKPGEDVVILIGPEGDFSRDELELAFECGFLPVTFGESRLRTETAALYAVEAVHILEEISKP